MDRSKISQILRAGGLFAPLSDDELAFLAARTSVRKFASGELLFSEGDRCKGFYLIASGRVRIFKTSANGREHVLAVEGPGSSIAELPVFDGGNYPASAVAADDSELLFISREDFRSMCLEHPEIALKVLQVVGARLRRLVGIIEELSFTTVRHRLIAWLLRRARTDGPTFTMDVNHQEIASQIGTVRELVSRNLARLQAQGLIAIEGRQITIADADGLQADLDSVV